MLCGSRVLCMAPLFKRCRIDHAPSSVSLLTINDDCIKIIADFLGRSCCTLMRVCQSCWSILCGYSIQLNNYSNINDFLDSSSENRSRVRYIKLEISTVRMLKKVLDVINFPKLFKLTVSIPARHKTRHPGMLLKKYVCVLSSLF